jgi:hypothetical protein
MLGAVIVSASRQILHGLKAVQDDALVRGEIQTEPLPKLALLD